MVKDLKIDTKRRLTGDMKRAFANQIEQAFSNNENVMSIAKTERREKLLSEFREKSGYHSLKKKLDALEAQKVSVAKAINELGLDPEGDLLRYHASEKAMSRARNVEKMIEAHTKQYDFDRCNKSKLITRMWLADTFGEATVIMNEVLGNGLIPSLTQKQLE